MSNRADELIKHSKFLSAQNKLCSSLSNLSLQLYERLLKAGYAKSDEEFKEITKFFFERMPKVSYNKLGFRGNSFLNNNEETYQISFFGGSTVYNVNPPNVNIIENILLKPPAK